MESRKGVVLKNPTMAQRKAIVAIAQSEDLAVHRDGQSILDEYFPWVWFGFYSGELSGCLSKSSSTDKYVSFEKFVEHMYQEKRGNTDSYLEMHEGTHKQR